MAIRPEDLVLGTEGLAVTVTDVTFLGDRLRRTLRLSDGTMLRASGSPGDADHRIGGGTRVGFPADRAVILPA